MHSACSSRYFCQFWHVTFIACKKRWDALQSTEKHTSFWRHGFLEAWRKKNAWCPDRCSAVWSPGWRNSAGLAAGCCSCFFNHSAGLETKESGANHQQTTDWLQNVGGEQGMFPGDANGNHSRSWRSCPLLRRASVWLKCESGKRSCCAKFPPRAKCEKIAAKPRWESQEDTRTWVHAAEVFFL